MRTVLMVVLVCFAAKAIARPNWHPLRDDPDESPIGGEDSGQPHGPFTNIGGNGGHGGNGGNAQVHSGAGHENGAYDHAGMEPSRHRPRNARHVRKDEADEAFTAGHGSGMTNQAGNGGNGGNGGHAAASLSGVGGSQSHPVSAPAPLPPVPIFDPDMEAPLRHSPSMIGK